jgi:hypothetical protein
LRNGVKSEKSEHSFGAISIQIDASKGWQVCPLLLGGLKKILVLKEAKNGLRSTLR